MGRLSSWKALFDIFFQSNRRDSFDVDVDDDLNALLWYAKELKGLWRDEHDGSELLHGEHKKENTNSDRKAISREKSDIIENKDFIVAVELFVRALKVSNVK